MAKNRFKLTMDDGFEVNTVDELKEHFGEEKIVGYLQDDSLVTWLRDRYEDELADEVSKIKSMYVLSLFGTQSKEDAQKKKLREIFGIPSAETVAHNEETARERDRKLSLLEKYPWGQNYVDRVMQIAFSQDDLYDLLDEGEKEILLCGEKFALPVSKGNMKYIGISENVEVTIGSHNPNILAEKNIVIENCFFDQAYNKVLENAEEKEKLGIDSAEIGEFVKKMKESLDQFDSLDYEDNDDVELYEYDDSIECDTDLYNESGFESESKAKIACKKELTKAIDEIKTYYESAKSELIDTAEEYYAPMCERLCGFFDEMQELAESMFDIYCTGSTKEHLEKKIHTLTSFAKQAGCADVEKLLKNKLTELVKTEFGEMEKKILAMKELFELCDIDEDDDEYGFTIDDAAEELIESYTDIIETEEDSFPGAVFDLYSGCLTRYIGIVNDWLKQLTE